MTRTYMIMNLLSMSINFVRLSLTSQVAHYCWSLSRFPLHEATRSIATRPGWDASPSQVTSQHFVRFPCQFAGTHLHVYSWVERGTARVKCLAQEHNTMTWPGLEPGPLNLESSTQTTRPTHLPLLTSYIVLILSSR